MTELINCPCGNRFPNNPEKHRHRPKLCPKCKQPYTKPSIWKKPDINFKRIKKGLQSIFRFYPKTQDKTVIYSCPVCKQNATNNDDMNMTRYPDKTKPVFNEQGKQVDEVIASWKLVPTCKKCGSHLVRRRLK